MKLIALTFEYLSNKINRQRVVFFMTSELFKQLEERVELLLGQFVLLKRENERLVEENCRLTKERSSLRSRIDVIIEKLEGFEHS